MNSRSADAALFLLLLLPPRNDRAVQRAITEDV